MSTCTIPRVDEWPAAAETPGRIRSRISPRRPGDYTLIVQSSWGLGPYFFDLSAGAAGAVLASDDDDAGGENNDLYVAVTTNNSTYALREWVHVEVTVTENTDTGALVEGASVHTEISTASGKIYGADGTTNAAGQAFFDFRPKKPDGVGPYNITATASASGYDQGYSELATFSVMGPSNPKVASQYLQQDLPTVDDRGDTEGYGMPGHREVISFMLFELNETISELGPEDFSNEESAIELANGIGYVLAMCGEDLCVETISVLETDILKRTDGLANKQRRACQGFGGVDQE